MESGFCFVAVGGKEFAEALVGDVQKLLVRSPSIPRLDPPTRQGPRQLRRMHTCACSHMLLCSCLPWMI